MLNRSYISGNKAEVAGGMPGLVLLSSLGLNLTIKLSATEREDDRQ
jgi:hypothetical protein